MEEVLRALTRALKTPLGILLLLSHNSLRRFYLPILLGLCVGYALRPIGPGYDFWAHAAVGRWIWNHKSVPTHSLFLWSAEGFPWIAHSWLSQLFFYGLIESGGGWTPRGNTSVGTGPIAVVVFTTVVACVVWTLLWRLWNRRSWSFVVRGARVPIVFVSPLFFATAIWVAAPRYQPRQEMLTALFLTVLLSYLIERHAPFQPKARAAQTENASTETADETVVAQSSEPEISTDAVRFAENANAQNANAQNALSNQIATNAALVENAPHAAQIEEQNGEAQNGLANQSSTRLQRQVFPQVSPQEVLPDLPHPSSERALRFGVREGLLVAMFALWVNLHALAALALALLFATALCDAVQDRFDRRSRVLLGLAFACALATLINPFGAHWIEAAAQLKPGNMANYIEEWWPPWRAENLRVYVKAEVFLATMALLAWAWNPRRRASHALWVVVMMTLFLKQRRHLWLAALVFLAVMAANSGFFDSQRWWRAWKRLLREPESQPIPLPMRRIAQGGILFCLGIGAWQSFSREWPRSLVSRRVPEGVAFALESGQRNRTLPAGNLFNDYATSSYLQWRLNRADASGNVPSRGLNPLYIDLLNAYPDGEDGLLKEYFGFLENKRDAKSRDQTPGLQLLDKRAVNMVYLPDEANFNKQWLALYLKNDRKTWRQIYKGRDGTLWARKRFLPVANAR